MSGVGGAANLGTFSGGVITANTDIKNALQELETDLVTQTDDQDASEVSYDNTGNSVITTGTVQLALGEIDGAVDTNTGDVATNAGDIATNAGDVGNLQTLSGVGGAANLGMFSGGVITANTDIKNALQELETAVGVAEADPVWVGDRTTLASAGTINNVGNLIDWTQLKNVPGDFADGLDADFVLPFTGSDNTTGNLFEITQSGSGRAASFTQSGSGNAVLIDMNSSGNPAILFSQTTVPFQIPGASTNGKVLKADGSGNVTLQPGFGTVDEATFNIYTDALSGTGSSLSTGTNNTLIGQTVGNGINTGSGNVMLGSLTGASITSGNDNIGIGTNSIGGTLTTGSGNILVGNSAIIAGGSPSTSDNIAIGTGAQVQVGNSIAIGNGASTIAPSGTSIGTSASSTGTASIAIGNGSIADGTNSIALGISADNGGAEGAVAVGEVANATGEDAVAIGTNSVSSNVESTAIGSGATANGSGSVTIGNAMADGDLSIALGAASQTTGGSDQAIAIGTFANSDAIDAIAIGAFAAATADGAVAIGTGSNSSMTNTVTLGSVATPYNLSVTGAQYVGVRSLSGTINETVQANDYILFFTPGSNGIVELPPATAANVGRKLIFCTNGNATNIDINTENGAPSIIFSNGGVNSITIRRDNGFGTGAVLSLTLVLVAPDVWMVTSFEGNPF